MQISIYCLNVLTCSICGQLTLWRNDSVSDSRPEGCMFKSRQGQGIFLPVIIFFIVDKTKYWNFIYKHTVWRKNFGTYVIAFGKKKIGKCKPIHILQAIDGWPWRALDFTNGYVTKHRKCAMKTSTAYCWSVFMPNLCLPLIFK